MADYPDLIQAFGTRVDADDGTVVDRAVSGKPRFRSYYSTTRREIRVVHDLDETGYTALKDHYEANKYDAFDITMAQSNDLHSVRYAEPPQFIIIAGGRWSARVRLIEV